VVPPPLRPLLVLLPQHDAECPSRVISDAPKVHALVAGLEVVPPASQERINPFPYEVREIPVLSARGPPPGFSS